MNEQFATVNARSLCYDALNMLNTLSFEEWRTRQLQFNVYYSELEYTFIEETPAMSKINFISSIGGALGLFVSVSFFTLLEIGELSVLLLYSWLQKCSHLDFF